MIRPSLHKRAPPVAREEEASIAGVAQGMIERRRQTAGECGPLAHAHHGPAPGYSTVAAATRCFAGTTPVAGAGIKKVCADQWRAMATRQHAPAACRRQAGALLALRAGAPIEEGWLVCPGWRNRRSIPDRAPGVQRAGVATARERRNCCLAEKGDLAGFACKSATTHPEQQGC